MMYTSKDKDDNKDKKLSYMKQLCNKRKHVSPTRESLQFLTRFHHVYKPRDCQTVMVVTTSNGTERYSAMTAAILKNAKQIDLEQGNKIKYKKKNGESCANKIMRVVSCPVFTLVALNQLLFKSTSSSRLGPFSSSFFSSLASSSPPRTISFEKLIHCLRA